MYAFSRWLLVLPMVAMALLPFGSGGIVLCVDNGPNAHVAIEWGPCDVSRCVPAIPTAPQGPSAGSETQCTACEDLPLPRWDARGIVRLQIPDVAVAPPSAGGFVLAPRHVGSPALHAAVPRPRVAPSLPLALRI